VLRFLANASSPRAAVGVRARSCGLNLQPTDRVGRELARAKAAPASWRPTLTIPKQETVGRAGGGRRPRIRIRTKS
jgi:hypothetical protein